MSDQTVRTFQLIPLAQLHESSLNPRKHFDAEALKELAASVKEHGVLTPLLVRPNAKGYEIGAGHRRYRAAKLAGLEACPAVVREMSDEAFLELLNVENLLREDVHPLEEAEGYRLLMQRGGYDAARLAERVGKSVKYVYDRIKLLALTKPAQQLFWDWDIEQRKREEERKREESARARWEKAAARAGGLLGSLVLEACQGAPWQGRKQDPASYIPRGATAEDLVRHAAFTVLAGELASCQAPREFPKRAKAFGLDVRKIVDEVAPATPVDKPAQTSAKRKRQRD